MNCLEAQATISAAHDGEIVSEASLVVARAHCDECEECTAFAEGLRALDTVPVPRAPKGLVERVMDAVTPLAADREAARTLEAARGEMADAGVEVLLPDAQALDVPALPESSTTSSFARRFEWFQGPAKWASLGAAAALAATALVAFVVIGVGGGRSGTPTASTSSGAGTGVTNSQTNQRGAAAAAALAPVTAPAQAPDYVLFNGFVYSPGALLTDSSNATPTIGTLTTAFASGGAAEPATVYRSPLTDGSIVVQGPDGMRLYSPVLRYLASVKYQLTSGNAVASFGVWPTLPTRFPVPTAANGTPTFVAAGTDALGVRVYAAAGRALTEGFAVARGTPTSDPAAGNPNWTWWAPAPANP
jgi:hypothetical protein